MKKLFLITLVLISVLCCRKKQIPSQNIPLDPYARPWKTEFISYKNIQHMCGFHSNGCELYYKDSLRLSECVEYGELRLQQPFKINDSTMVFFKPTYTHGAVLYTSNGGFSWAEIYTGPMFFSKFHLVHPELIYCVTNFDADLFITGIGKSDLSAYKISNKKGRYYISDPGTIVTNIDSTVIDVNDSLSFVVRFK